MAATGEGTKLPLKATFDCRIKPELHGAGITADGGLLACREPDDAPGLSAMARRPPPTVATERAFAIGRWACCAGWATVACNLASRAGRTFRLTESGRRAAYQPPTAPHLRNVKSTLSVDRPG